MAKIGDVKMNVFVKITNVDQFKKLTMEFTQKAHKLQEIAHELEQFRFEGQIENKVLSDDTN